jgi:integrase
VLWRGGVRVQEALALGERDLDPRRGSLLVRSRKGGRARACAGSALLARSSSLQGAAFDVAAI